MGLSQIDSRPHRPEFVVGSLGECVEGFFPFLRHIRGVEEFEEGLFFGEEFGEPRESGGDAQYGLIESVLDNHLLDLR